MLKEIRCLRCGRRLFDVTEKTIGPVVRKCKCKKTTIYYSKDRITTK